MRYDVQCHYFLVLLPSWHFFIDKWLLLSDNNFSLTSKYQMKKNRKDLSYNCLNKQTDEQISFYWLILWNTFSYVRYMHLCPLKVYYPGPLNSARKCSKYSWYLSAGIIVNLYERLQWAIIFFDKLVHSHSILVLFLFESDFGGWTVQYYWFLLLFLCNINY